MDYIDTIVLNGLKQSCLTSLKSMYTQVSAGNTVASLQELDEATTDTTGPHQVVIIYCNNYNKNNKNNNINNLIT